MKKRKKIEIFHLLFMETVRDPRATATNMAITLGRTGRGQTVSSATRQLYNMYKEKVSFPPRMILKNYEGYEFHAFFCRKKGRGLANIFFELYRKTIRSEISMTMCLAGNYDFFIMSRSRDINFKQLHLEVVKESKIFDPFATVPTGWNSDLKECRKRVLRTTFSPSKLKRKCHGELDWKKLQWTVYWDMHSNLRTSYKSVAEKAQVYSDTVKYNLYKKVLPSCTIWNYFFPKGYDNYDKLLVKFKSEYENDLMKAFSKLPCTSYIYPLKDEVTLILFHDDVRQIFFLTKKLEENEIVDDILLSVPLAHTL